LSPEIHARISKEEYIFLKSIGVNKSQLIRDAIHKLMDELPENLKRRKEELLKEIKKIDKKLESVETRKGEEKKYLNVIADDFQRFHRENHGDAQNIEWLGNRYKKKLDAKNILMPMEDILEYCIKKIGSEKP